MEENYYNILEISPAANQEDIKDAYRRLAFKYHPDKNNSSHEAEILFAKISQAYSVLSNKLNRREYDESLIGKRNKTAPKNTANRQQAYDIFIEDMLKVASTMSINERRHWRAVAKKLESIGCNATLALKIALEVERYRKKNIIDEAMHNFYFAIICLLFGGNVAAVAFVVWRIFGLQLVSVILVVSGLYYLIRSVLLVTSAKINIRI